VEPTVRQKITVPTSAGEEFGKDHGLVHEALVTGRKVGAGREFWSLLAHNEYLFHLLVSWTQGTSPHWNGNGKNWLSADQRRAQTIMGENFISPWEVLRVLPTKFRYGLPDLLDLGNIPFSEATMRDCQQTHVLLPGFLISIGELWDIFPDFAMPTRKSPSVKRLFEYTVPKAWFLIQKEGSPETSMKSLAAQKQMLNATDVVLNFTEAVWVALLYRAIRGGKMFDKTVRTSLPSDKASCVNVVTRNGWHVDFLEFPADKAERWVRLGSMKKSEDELHR
jgi:hypothetical protein